MNQLRAWLCMIPVDGDYPIPTSEAAYKANSSLIDTVSPVNGGVLQADGTWAQTSGASSAFGRELPGLAERSGQRYVPVLNPGHGMGPANLQVVLDDERLQQKAIAGAVELATTRFDAPWDGVMYDVLGVGPDHVGKHEAFLLALGEAVWAAGLSFEVACEARQPINADSIPSMTALDAAADRIDLYCYNWRGEPDSLQPYWWAGARLGEAIGDGVSPEKLNLGIALCSRYHQDAGGFRNITYDQAMQLVKDNRATVRWVEDHEAGLIREKYAAIGNTGHLWIHDGDTVRPRLALVDEYDLGGVMLFILGCEAESVWDTIAAWKRPPPGCRPIQRIKRPKTGNHHCALTGSGGLLSNAET